LKRSNSNKAILKTLAWLSLVLLFAASPVSSLYPRDTIMMDNFQFRSQVDLDIELGENESEESYEANPRTCFTVWKECQPNDFCHHTSCPVMIIPHYPDTPIPPPEID
jgi:hypothetical protein